MVTLLGELCQLSCSSHGSAGQHPHGMGCHPGAASQEGKIPAPCKRWVPAAGTPAGEVSAGAGLSAGCPCAAEPCLLCSSAACSHPPGCVCGPAELPMPPAGLHRPAEAGCPQRTRQARAGGQGGPPPPALCPTDPRRSLCCVAAGKVEKGPRGASCTAARRSLQAAHAPDGLRLRGELREHGRQMEAELRASPGL